MRTNTGQVSMWEFQRYFVEALFKHRRVAVRGPRRVGKSHMIGPAVAAFFWTAPSRVLMLSPTLGQNRNVAWASIHSAIAGATRDLPGEKNTMSVRLGPDAYIVSATTKNESSVRGYHSGTAVPDDPDADEMTEEQALELIAQDNTTRFLIWVDESQDRQMEAVHRALDGMMGQENVYIVKTGNPYLGLDDDHGFVRACKPGSRYHRIHVSGYGLAEYDDPLCADKTFDKVPAYLMSQEWKETMLRDYGEDSPTFRSDVLGQFSEGSTEDLCVIRSMLVAALTSKPENGVGPRIGIDLGFVADPCVASLFVNRVKVAEYEWLPDSDDEEAQESIAIQIASLAVTWGKAVHKKYPEVWENTAITGERISIDDTGLTGVCGNLARKGIYVDRVIFSEAADGHHAEIVGEYEFANVRAEMYWCARRLLQENMAQIPEKWTKSWQQAQWTHFEREFTKKGQVIKMEKKPDVKKRHGRSPDNWDADVLALRETAKGIGVVGSGASRKRRKARKKKRGR